MNANTLDEKKKALSKDIESLSEKQERKRRTTARMYSLLVALGLGLSIAAVVTGFVEPSGVKISPILVILVGIPVGLERTFRFGEKKDFHRLLVSEFYNLKVALQYSVNTEEKFQTVLDKFQSVVARAAKSVPKGQGMQAVKTLYEELDSKGIVPVSPDLLAKP